MFFAFAKAELPIVKLVRNTKTLEDIFLEATSDKPQEEAVEEVSSETAEMTEEKEASEDVSDL